MYVNLNFEQMDERFDLIKNVLDRVDTDKYGNDFKLGYLISMFSRIMNDEQEEYLLRRLGD